MYVTLSVTLSDFVICKEQMQIKILINKIKRNNHGYKNMPIIEEN